MYSSGKRRVLSLVPSIYYSISPVHCLETQTFSKFLFLYNFFYNILSRKAYNLELNVIHDILQYCTTTVQCTVHYVQYIFYFFCLDFLKNIVSLFVCSNWVFQELRFISFCTVIFYLIIVAIFAAKKACVSAFCGIQKQNLFLLYRSYFTSFTSKRKFTFLILQKQLKITLKCHPPLLLSGHVKTSSRATNHKPFSRYLCVPICITVYCCTACKCTALCLLISIVRSIFARSIYLPALILTIILC